MSLLTARWTLLYLCVFFLGSTTEPIPGSLFELVDERGRRISRLEASGIAYFNGNLIVVDDTLNFLFVFDRDGKLSQQIESDRFPRGRAKFEDITFDESTGSFFAVGSHEGRSSDVLEALSVLLSFRLKENGTKLEVDEETVERLPLYRSFERLGLWKPGGMKIEGLAYDPDTDHLYIGLREPRDRARVYRLSVEQLKSTVPSDEPPLPEEVLSFDAGRVEASPFCISALLWLPTHRGLLIATSTEDDTTHEFLGNRLWFLSLARGVRLIQDTFDRGNKAEGLAVGGDLLFISYDNDQDDTGIPSQLRVVPLEPLLGPLP